MPKLSDTKIRAAKARPKPYKLFDTDGLFLIIKSDDSKWWRQKYRWAGVEKSLSCGVYPEVGLGAARETSLLIRKQVANGIDPSALRKDRKLAQIDATANTFKSVATHWHKKFSVSWTPRHASRVLRRLEMHVFPKMGAKPFRDVKASDVQIILDALASQKKIDTALRVLQYLKDIAIYAVGRQLVAASPFAHIKAKHELPVAKVKHRAAIKDPRTFGALLRSIDDYAGSYVVKCALQFISITFVRPVECREALWSEFQLDGDTPLWRLPAKKMKMSDDFLVPLSKQVVSLLRQLHAVTGDDKRGRVFPGVKPGKSLSENTLNSAIRAMGFTKEQHCSHGFRGTASTFLNEHQWPGDVVELQLAHDERDETRASYNAAQHLPKRREMMQWWANHLDALRTSDNVVSIKRRA